MASNGDYHDSNFSDVKMYWPCHDSGAGNSGNKKTNPNPSPSAVDSHPSTFNPSDSQIWSPQVISKDDHRKHY